MRIAMLAVCCSSQPSRRSLTWQRAERVLLSGWLGAILLFGGCAHHPTAPARPAGSNVEIEMSFDGPAHLVTSVVSRGEDRQVVTPSRPRTRVVHLSLPPGSHQLLLSQLFDEVFSVAPLSGHASNPTTGNPIALLTGNLEWGHGQALAGDCFNEASLELDRGARFRLRQIVHGPGRCELSCAVEVGGAWSATNCSAGTTSAPASSSEVAEASPPP